MSPPGALQRRSRLCRRRHTPYQKGDTRKFWIMNSDTIENFEIDATLRYVTPHSYFWVENGVNAR